MPGSLTLLSLLALLVLYVWHEAEEYLVLLPWFAANRHRLPLPMRRLALPPQSFLFIAGEQLVLILGVWLFLPPLWLSATIFAYTLHLLIHCVQMVFTWCRRIFLPLWSAPLQLLVCIALYLAQATPHSAEQMLANVIMTVAMVLNLALMHYLATRILAKH